MGRLAVRDMVRELLEHVRMCLFSDGGTPRTTPSTSLRRISCPVSLVRLIIEGTETGSPIFSVPSLLSTGWPYGKNIFLSSTGK